MDKGVINILTIIAFVLIPILAIVRLIYPTPGFGLDYGNQEVTLNSVLLLFFAIYCFFVCIFRFIETSRSWREDNPKWKREMKLSYLFAILLAISLAFLMMFSTVKNYNYETKTYSYTSRFIPLNFLLGLFSSLAFLFPVGLVLLILGFSSLKYKLDKPKSYLTLTFITSILFTLGGALPALLTFLYWAGGGGNFLNLCYCPVNHKSFSKDIFLKPLYNYRRNKLRERLNI